MISYTVYSRGQKLPTVGITFQPTPSLTIRDLTTLIQTLEQVKTEMYETFMEENFDDNEA